MLQKTSNEMRMRKLKNHKISLCEIIQINDNNINGNQLFPKYTIQEISNKIDHNWLLFSTYNRIHWLKLLVSELFQTKTYKRPIKIDLYIYVYIFRDEFLVSFLNQMQFFDTYLEYLQVRLNYEVKRSYFAVL